MTVEYFVLGGKKFVPEQPPAQQQPQPEPLTGTRMKPGDRFVYVIHDDLDPGYNYQARTLTDKINLAITNELRVPRRWYWRTDVGEWRVDRYSKIEFWPEELPGDWEYYFFSGMTERQHALFNVSGFGWRDQKANAILAFIAGLVNKVRLWVQDRKV